MCTAVTYKKDCFYFGRTLDYEISYGDKITVTPRNFRFNFGSVGAFPKHLSMFGMANTDSGYPLYYDAVNENGLAMAGLNFVDNAVYGTKNRGRYPIAPHEFIPFLLGQCKDLSQARELLKEIRLENRAASDKFPTAQLHWIIADKSGALTVESTKSGMYVYENPFGVLTNNPDFPHQLLQLSNYAHLSAKPQQNNFCSPIPLPQYTRGLGAVGLPGDWSSESRFVRAAFVKMNSVSGNSETDAVNQFFHIMNSVNVPRGCIDLGSGKYNITRYTCCCNCDKGIYYYTTYGNHRITAVNMRHEDLEGSKLICYEPISEEQILEQN